AASKESSARHSSCSRNRAEKHLLHSKDDADYHRLTIIAVCGSHPVDKADCRPQYSTKGYWVDVVLSKRGQINPRCGNGRAHGAMRCTRYFVGLRPSPSVAVTASCSRCECRIYGCNCWKA